MASTRLLMVSTISRFLRDFLFPYAAHYRARGWQVDALTSEVERFPECRKQFERVWSVSWSRSPFACQPLWDTAQDIEHIVEREGYDLVHVHTPVAAFVTRYALRALRRTRPVRLIYTAHGFHFQFPHMAPKDQLYLALERLAGRWTDQLIVINATDAQAVRHYGIVPEARLWHHPGIGLDADYYQPADAASATGRAVRRQLDIPDTATVFSVIAEFVPRKRHADVLRAFRNIDRTQTRLVFAGAGPGEAAMRKAARRYGVAEQVRFLGFQVDIRPLVRASNAVILASAQEGLPRCIMESLAMGIPVIGTDIRGTHELLSDGAGTLVPLGDSAALAAAMTWVREHPEEARRTAQTGQRRVVNKYRLSHLLALHDELYEHALEGTPARDMAGVLDGMAGA